MSRTTIRVDDGSTLYHWACDGTDCGSSVTMWAADDNAAVCRIGELGWQQYQNKDLCPECGKKAAVVDAYITSLAEDSSVSRPREGVSTMSKPYCSGCGARMSSIGGCTHNTWYCPGPILRAFCPDCGAKITPDDGICGNLRCQSAIVMSSPHDHLSGFPNQNEPDLSPDTCPNCGGNAMTLATGYLHKTGCPQILCPVAPTVPAGTYGWICPVCKRAVNPTIAVCDCVQAKH